MINLTFYSFAEKTPEHGEEIILISRSSSFGYKGFSPQTGDIEYQWTELTDSGNPTGCSIVYDYEKESDFDYPVKLDVVFAPSDSSCATILTDSPHDFWMLESDFAAQMDDLPDDADFGC